jgi:hypothetical protein
MEIAALVGALQDLIGGVGIAIVVTLVALWLMWVGIAAVQVGARADRQYREAAYRDFAEKPWLERQSIVPRRRHGDDWKDAA